VYAELDRWEQIHVDMDALAKLHWIKVKNNHRPHFDLPHHSSEWSIWHRGKRLPRWSEKLALTLIHTTPSQQQYWYQRQRLNPYGPTPAWATLYQAYKTAPTRSKLWTSKCLSGWVLIGANMKQWKLSTTDVCPRCGEPETHRHHVLDIVEYHRGLVGNRR
jgi:hypothetical protein